MHFIYQLVSARGSIICSFIWQRGEINLQLSAGRSQRMIANNLQCVMQCVSYFGVANGCYQFAVICSNVFKNSCFDFAAYSKPCIGNWSLSVCRYPQRCISKWSLSIRSHVQQCKLEALLANGCSVTCSNAPPEMWLRTCSFLDTIVIANGCCRFAAICSNVSEQLLL